MNASETISICAITLTVCGLYATMRHNMLSVTPHLDGCHNKDMTPEGFLFSYDISNNGIGPAKIKNFILYRNGKPTPRGNGDYIEAVIREHLGERVYHQIKRQFNIGNNSSIRAGNTIRIIELLFPTAKPEDVEKIIKELQEIDLRIEYQSFYGQKFVLDTRDRTK
jgi:hypothetical protein